MHVNSFDGCLCSTETNASCCRHTSSMADAISDEPRTLTSLPAELLMLVAEDLDVRCLARFAAACKVCLAAAEDELHAALLAVVEHCLVPGSRLISNALAACPYLFCLSSAVVFPAGTFVDSASIIKLTLPASLTTIGIGAFGLRVRL